MKTPCSIFVAGHRGMVGSAIVRLLEKIVGVTIFKRTRQQLDLRNEKAVIDYFNSHCPDIVVLAAAKVGGIQANIESPGDFLYDNLAIQNNVIENIQIINLRKQLVMTSTIININKRGTSNCKIVPMNFSNKINIICVNECYT